MMMIMIMMMIMMVMKIFFDMEVVAMPKTSTPMDENTIMTIDMKM